MNQKYSITLLFLYSTVYSYDFQSDGICYTIISETDCTVEVSKNNNSFYRGNLIIPSQVTKYGQTYTVKRIGADAFSDCNNLYSVSISESVDSIYTAFSGCSALTEINVDSDNPFYKSIDGVLFDKSVTHLLRFPDGKGGNYIIPNGVKVISSYAFVTNNNLHSLSMPSSVTRIENQAIQICYNLNNIVLSSSLEYIGDGSIMDCGFSQIILPQSLKYIGNDAFNGCKKLKSLNIPKNVEYIGDNSVFGYCPSLEQIEVDSNNSYYISINGILYDKEVTKVLKCPSNIQDYEWVTLPSTIKSIGYCAFHTNKNLTRITIPAGVTTIGNGAFYYCSNLSRVTCYARTPPSTPSEKNTSSDPWDYSGRNDAILYVPKGCAETYRDFYNLKYSYGSYTYVYPWASFKTIIEMDDESDIIDINNDPIEKEIIYNISGTKAYSTFKGINLIRSKNGSIKKVIKK